VVQDLSRPEVSVGTRAFRRRVAGALLLASFLMGLPALEGGLLSYDDRALLEGPEGAPQRSLWSLVTETHFKAYLPLYAASYKLDALVFRGEPAGYRIGNVLWHAAAGYALFLVLARLSGAPHAAFGGALLFVLHPAHVESVAWIAGRKEPLSAFFLFVAWILHLRAEERGGAGRLFAWAAFLAACFAKASAVVLPGLLLAAALLLPRYAGARRAAALRTVPFFLVALVPAVVHLLVAGRAGVVGGGDPLAARLVQSLHALGRSVLHAALPFDLSVDYPEARAPSTAALAASTAALVAFLGAGALAFRNGVRWAAFGVAAFLVGLAPFNNVFPATTTQMADRYLYLPLVAVSAVSVWAIPRFSLAPLATGALALLYAVLSFASAGRFASDETLWTRTLASRDDSAVAWINRGRDRIERGASAAPPDSRLVDAGRADLEAGLARATRLEHRVKAHHGLSGAYLALGRPADAVTHADDAVRLARERGGADAREQLASALYNRAIAWKALGRPAKTLEDLEASAAIRRTFLTAYEIGEAALATGNLARAEQAFEEASKLDRADPAPVLRLAEVCRFTGERARRERHLEEAARRAPKDVRVARAWVEFRLDAESPDHDRARREAARLPAGSRERVLLEAEVDAAHATYQFRRGDLAAALASADRSVEGGVASPSALYDIGNIYVEGGRFQDAVRCFHRAADALSDRQAYRDAVGRAHALDAYARLARGDRAGAAAAMRAAAESGAGGIDAGAAPLLGELEALRRAGSAPCLLLAAAAVAGDAPLAERLALEVIEGEAPEEERTLALRLRALARAFAALDFEGAQADLQEILARDPRDRWARFRLGQILARSGAAWKKVGEEAGSEDRRAEGRALLLRATAIFSQLLDEDPSFHVARVARGAAHFALGSPDDLLRAKADFRHVAERDPSAKEVLLNEAALHRLAYVRGGDLSNLDSAVRLLAKALDVDPNYFDALFELGNVQHLLFDRQDAPRADRLRAFGLAVKWYRRAMAINPRSREPRREYAAITLKVAREAQANGQFAEAESLVRKAEEHGAQFPDVWKERARLLLTPGFPQATGRTLEEAYAQAERALDEAARLSPDDPELAPLRARLHRQRGYLFYFGWLAEKEGDRREALRRSARDAWVAALDAAPEDPENAQARERLREIAPEAIGPDRELARKRFEAGVRALAERRWDEAEAAFREVVRLFPETPEFRFALGRALAGSGRLDEAQAEWERVANDAEGAAKFPESLFELGKLCRQRRNTAAARAWFQRFVEAMESAGRADDPTVEAARAFLAGSAK
jgi:tetratricopeptide (TPR) repeat protein